MSTVTIGVPILTLSFRSAAVIDRGVPGSCRTQGLAYMHWGPLKGISSRFQVVKDFLLHRRPPIVCPKSSAESANLSVFRYTRANESYVLLRMRGAPK